MLDTKPCSNKATVIKISNLTLYKTESFLQEYLRDIRLSRSLDDGEVSVIPSHHLIILVNRDVWLVNIVVGTEMAVSTPEKLVKSVS